MEMRTSFSRRPRRRRRSLRRRKPLEVCPCTQKTGKSSGYVQGVQAYYAVQKLTNNDATYNEFVEFCHPITHHCADGFCQLFWSYMNDYEQAWISKDPHEELHEGGEFRTSGLNWEQVTFKDMQTVSRWIYYSLSQAAKRRAK